MLHTRLCDLLGIASPVIQAGMSVCTGAALVAAVSNAGGLGSLGAWRRPAADLRAHLTAIRERTARPFAVNHVVPDLDEEAFALIPQVVDAVGPLPVVAAGGIADGRGLAAALVLGAAGVNLGTRFLASIEAPIGAAWKAMIVAAASEEVVAVDVINDGNPVPGATGYGTVLRARSTPFIGRWQRRRDEVRRDPEPFREELRAARRAGRLDALLPAAGQSAGLIREILPTGEIVRRLVGEAEQTLATAGTRGFSNTPSRAMPPR